MLLAVTEIPQGPEVLDRAASLCGLVRYDMNQRLSGPLPRIIISAPEEKIATLGEALTALGFISFPCDPAVVPGEAECLMARRLEWSPQGLVVFDRADRRHECPHSAMALIQRGQRTTKTTTTSKTTEKKFSLSRAAMSGGLILNKKVDKETTQESVVTESFLAVQRGDGEPDILLYERRLDYRYLGADMAPASQANLLRTAERLRAAAPHVPFDERIARSAFVSGLPRTAADPVDLALYLVRLAQLCLGRLPG